MLTPFLYSLSDLGMSQSEAGRRTVLPDGVWPTMITPFLDDEGKSVDWKGLDSKFSPNLLDRSIASYSLVFEHSSRYRFVD